MEPVERRDEPRVDTAQRTPLPSVALPAPGPTSLDTPPSAAVAPPPAPATPSVPPALAVAPPPPAAQPQMTAAAPPSSTQSIPKTTAKSSTKSTGPTPLPAVEPPKPADATPPPPATPAAPSLAAQPTPAPPQQAALPERAPTPRTATPPAPESMEIRFAAGDANLPDDGKARLDKLADNLKANEASRLQLLAYAGEDQISPSKARRLSLSRALAVRSYLIAKGIRSTRIDVRALGDQVPGGDPNRVDLKVTDR